MVQSIESTLWANIIQLCQTEHQDEWTVPRYDFRPCEINSNLCGFHITNKSHHLPFTSLATLPWKANFFKANAFINTPCLKLVSVVIPNKRPSVHHWSMFCDTNCSFWQQKRPVLTGHLPSKVLFTLSLDGQFMTSLTAVVPRNFSLQDTLDCKTTWNASVNYCTCKWKGP